MARFDRDHDEPGRLDERERQEAMDMLDPYNSRASVTAGDRIAVQPSKVLDNIAVAMERVDIDIDTPISLEDVVSLDELASLIQQLRMGPLLVVHLVNTAMRIMSARYPADLVRTPLPEQFDLRKVQPALKVSDQGHEIAMTIFNRRTASSGDLASEDVVADLDPLGRDEQMEVFLILFFMFGTKVGALKQRTGIE